MTEPARLDPDQKEVWDVVMRPHLAEARKPSTQQQAVDLGVLSLLWWCDFDGMPCTEEAIKGEFEAAAYLSCAQPRTTGSSCARTRAIHGSSRRGVQTLGGARQLQVHQER